MSRQDEKKDVGSAIDASVIDDFLGNGSPKSNVVIQIENDLEIKFDEPVDITVYWVEKFQTVHLYKAVITPLPDYSPAKIPPVTFGELKREFARENDVQSIMKFFRAANVDPDAYMVPAYSTGTAWFYVKGKWEITDAILDYFVNAKLSKVSRHTTMGNDKK